ncbi:hypothetical protein BCR39DRAFT_540932 [Naematelia encephala]|uniref:50S ribosomal protein L35 n=1 Tax=Naematelia encephala TaxID=71784 RepID=A0A1Y2AV65_9TREE|nr:hypothetical protein BCR39DRAFT_540932 [Naematelia encephala]
MLFSSIRPLIRPLLSSLPGPSRIPLTRSSLPRPLPLIPSLSLSLFSLQPFSTSSILAKCGPHQGARGRLKERLARCSSYKMRSHAGAKKRFFQNADGEWNRYQSGKSHGMTSMTHSQHRSLSQPKTVTRAQARLLRKMLPYGARNKV